MSEGVLSSEDRSTVHLSDSTLTDTHLSTQHSNNNRTLQSTRAERPRVEAPFLVQIYGRVLRTHKHTFPPDIVAFFIQNLVSRIQKFNLVSFSPVLSFSLNFIFTSFQHIR